MLTIYLCSMSYSAFIVLFQTCIKAPDTTEADENGLDEACGGSEIPSESGDGVVNGIPIEESLFEEDDIDDLDLEELEIVE